MLRPLLALLALTLPIAAQAQTTLRIGWCSRTVTAAAAPFAIATQQGWFAKDGIKIELVPLPGSVDCAKLVATGQLPYALASIEAVPVLRSQGADIKNFYTAYQGNIYGIAVPQGSPIKTLADLKGKRIGVIAMASGGYVVARAIASTLGLNPDTDMKIVVAGEGAQTAALIRSNQIDALSQFDGQYALVENAGVKLTYIDSGPIARFPSNGFIALAEHLKTHRAEAIALGRDYAMGTVATMANPEAGIRAVWQAFPITRGTGRDDATALHDDTHVLENRLKNLLPSAGGVTRWGENSVTNYQAYLDYLLANKVIPAHANAADLLDNSMIDEVNAFDAAAITAAAKTGK